MRKVINKIHSREERGGRGGWQGGGGEEIR